MAYSRGEELFSCEDHLIEYEKAKSSIKKCWKDSVSINDEIGLNALYRFESTITHAVNCFVYILGVAECLEEIIRDEFLIYSAIQEMRSNKSKNRLQESACKLKCLLLISIANMMPSCSKTFKREAAAISVDAESELSAKATGLEKVCLRNDEREQTSAFKMLSNGHC